MAGVFLLDGGFCSDTGRDREFCCVCLCACDFGDASRSAERTSWVGSLTSSGLERLPRNQFN